MKYIKLIFIILIMMIFSGCSNTNIDSNNVPKKALQQRTMTKVQSNVNEIIGKNYDYILNNMGLPYSTTYSINEKDLNYAKNSIATESIDKDDIKNVDSIGLLYPNYTSNNKTDGSAIYITIRDDKVVKVQTCTFDDFEVSKILNKRDNITISSYNEYDQLDLKHINLSKVEEYINQTEENVSDFMKNKKYAYTIYKNNDNCEYKIQIYPTENKKYIVVGIKDNLIEHISLETYSNLVATLQNNLGL